MSRSRRSRLTKELTAKPAQISYDPVSSIYSIPAAALLFWAVLLYTHTRFGLAAFLIPMLIFVPLTLAYMFGQDIGPFRHIRAVFDCGDHLLVQCRHCEFQIRQADIYAVSYAVDYRAPDKVVVYLKSGTEVAKHFSHSLDDFVSFFPYNYAGWPMLDFAAWLHSEIDRGKAARSPFRST